MIKIQDKEKCDLRKRGKGQVEGEGHEDETKSSGNN
jgi:hypothetical protein